MKHARPAVTAALLGLAAATALAAPLHYRIVDLGVVGTGTASQAFGVSEDGMEVVGRDLGTGSNPAYAWTAATGSVALPNLPGRSYAQANGVNNVGLVVGTSTTTVFGSGAVPVAWTNGTVTALQLPAGETVGRATAVNGWNVIVGSIGSDVSERAAICGGISDTFHALGATLPNGRTMTYATGINVRGFVAGSGIDPHDAAVNVALMFDTNTGTTTDLGALPGDNSALAFGIGGGLAPYVVGSSMFDQGSGRPFIWSAAGGMVEIPLPPKTSEGAAYAVSIHGWAVGNGGGLYSVPFLYANGRTWPLQALLPANSGWDMKTNTSSSAMGISDRGTIVGTAVHDGQTHGYAMILVHPAEADAP